MTAQPTLLRRVIPPLGLRRIRGRQVLVSSTNARHAVGVSEPFHTASVDGVTLAYNDEGAGDAIVLRAEMDLAVAVSACPTSTCNGGAPPRPLAFEVLGG